MLPIEPHIPTLFQEGSCAYLNALCCLINIKIPSHTGTTFPTSVTDSTIFPPLPITNISNPVHHGHCLSSLTSVYMSLSDNTDIHRLCLDGCLTACSHTFPYTTSHCRDTPPSQRYLLSPLGLSNPASSSKNIHDQVSIYAQMHSIHFIMTSFTVPTLSLTYSYNPAYVNAPPIQYSQRSQTKLSLY